MILASPVQTIEGAREESLCALNYTNSKKSLSG